VPALDVACLIEGAAKRGRGTCHAIGRAAVDKGDDWHRLLLRARRERPRHRRSAEQRYELAPFHCPMPHVLHALVRQGTAALRDFNAAYVWSGSKPVRRRTSKCFPVLPQ